MNTTEIYPEQGGEAQSMENSASNQFERMSSGACNESLAQFELSRSFELENEVRIDAEP